MDNKNKAILAILAIALVISIIAYFVIPTFTLYASKENNSINEDSVKLGTFAVCEDKEGYTFCKDKLFASCNGVLLELNDSIFYCNGNKYNASNLPLGETYHVQNWTDPRSKDFITAWASAA